MYGASLSTYLGDANVAGEISLHHNTPLDFTAGQGSASLGSGYLGGIVLDPYGYGRRGTATRGTSVNAQVSAQAQAAPSRYADGATLQVELAGNELVSDQAPSGRTRFAVSVRAIYTPNSSRCCPVWIVRCPWASGSGLIGKSSVDASQNAGAGFVTVGLNATFRVVWQGGITYTHFIGGAGTQPLADRDFGLMSVTRTF